MQICLKQDVKAIAISSVDRIAVSDEVNQTILDTKQYLQVVSRSRAVVHTHLYAGGRLGSIQPIDEQPGKFKPSASEVHGVNRFLLADSELDELPAR